TVPEKALMNGWGNINYINGKFSAGLRYESYLNVMQGYPSGYKGTGIPYRYATYNNDGLEITVGSAYEQFGSGLVLRAYEDRGLGYDNALDGMRVRYNPYKGIYLKGVWGKQRNFFTTGPGIVRGFDGEINLNELFDSCMANVKTQFIFGGSFVSKYQPDLNPSLILPQNVGTWAARGNIITSRINLYGEYAYKINDPTIGNGYIYKPGQALFTSATYSQKGFGLYGAYMYVDNFGYRSDRDATGNSLMINYLPALTKQHTYLLAAFYPYASQPNGEVCWQGEADYKIRKGTKLGGKYGTTITLNYSVAHGIDTTQLNDRLGKDYGYSAKWSAVGDSLFYQDANIEIYREFFHRTASLLKVTVMYANMIYNKNVIEGHVNYAVVHANIGVVDVTWKVNKHFTFHTDAEHMSVGKTNGVVQDQGNWAMLLEEVSIGNHFFIAGMDEWNYGNPVADQRLHYYNVQAGFLKGTNRIAVGYGKQRAGIFCVGGVCRFVPASNGLTLTITSSF
ncbi:MAG TPA: DUF6029 family protein, partial [Bacteroidia bacterium]|nr:DUF6029 family protein [Bacteroidia bacterium]